MFERHPVLWCSLYVRQCIDITIRYSLDFTRTTNYVANVRGFIRTLGGVISSDFCVISWPFSKLSSIIHLCYNSMSSVFFFTLIHYCVTGIIVGQGSFWAVGPADWTQVQLALYQLLVASRIQTLQCDHSSWLPVCTISTLCLMHNPRIHFRF